MSDGKSDSELAKFVLNDQAELVQSILQGGFRDVGIRPVRFSEDIGRINEMRLEEGLDSINPAYGMAPETDEGELCLLAERDGEMVGQISCSLECRGHVQTNVYLWVTGIFVSAPERGKGIAGSLSKAALGITEAWRRQVAAEIGRDVAGSIIVDADTVPGSIGEMVVTLMEDHCFDLEEQSMDDAYGSEVAAP